MPLPDSHFLAQRDWMVLLAAVAAGAVVRGGPFPARASAQYLLDDSMWAASSTCSRGTT